jgi:hypothetical protein
MRTAICRRKVLFAKECIERTLREKKNLLLLTLAHSCLLLIISLFHFSLLTHCSISLSFDIQTSREIQDLSSTYKQKECTIHISKWHQTQWANSMCQKWKKRKDLWSSFSWSQVSKTRSLQDLHNRSIESYENVCPSVEFNAESNAPFRICVWGLYREVFKKRSLAHSWS